MLDMGFRVIFQGINFYRLLSGLWITVRIAIVAIIISIVFGILFGIIMTSKNKIIKITSRLYLETVRIIPILVWLFVFYFGFSRVTGIHIGGELVSIIVFSIWGIAEMGDIVRSAVISIPKHQIESGKAIGLTDKQLYKYIIIPQAIRRLIPAAINLSTRMIKTTSLVALIGVIEVLKVGQQIIEVSMLNNPTASLWVYGFIFFLYFIICYPISLMSKKLEQRWEY